jgi:isopenicillin N synthase-like dioxygenase
VSAAEAAGEAIPTLDFGPFATGHAQARLRVAQALGEAFHRYGFVSLVGHGLDRAAISGAFAAAEAFFGQPEEAKRRVQDRRNNRGYIPMFDSVLPGQKPGGHEAFSMGHPAIPADPELQALPFHAPTPWPDCTPGFRERLEACYGALYGLGQRILQAVALDLGAPGDVFAEAARESYSNMRIVHYPPQERIAAITDNGVRAHADEGLITLLVQDMNGGLSVQGPSGAWLPVVPDREAIVINAGKLLRHWTNGRYAAAMHMVVNRSGRERYSIPLFVHPSFRTVIDPMTLVGEAPAAAEFAPIVAGERVYANFKARRVSWREEPG